MKKLVLTCAALVSLGLHHVMAQSRPVKGQVLDDRGEGVPGASIQVKGTKTGTITDAEGNFILDVPDESNVLLIKSVGFGDKEVSAGDGDKQLVVTMSSSSQALDDVMVVAYGTTRKESYTGSAGVITSKQIEKMPVTDVTKALEGSVPGLQVTNGGGQPGSGAALRIRGFGSINASSSPLIVLDGAPYDGDITSINPMDIGSITLLKDATATSLYGARGANGVLMITTKKGKKGEKPQISVDARVGIVTRALPEYDRVTDEKQYYETAWEYYRNGLVAGGMTKEQAGRVASGLTTSPGIVRALGGYNSYNVPDNQLIDPVTGKLNPAATLKYHDDWQKELMRTGVRQDYNLNVSGGSDKTDYFFSAGYLKEQGFIKYSNYDRLQARMNVNSQVTDWLKAGLNMSGALSNQRYFSNTEDGSTAPGGNPFYTSRMIAPIYPVYWRDSLNRMAIDPATGENKLDWSDAKKDPDFSMGTRPFGPGSNILGSMAMDDDSRKMTNVTANSYLEATFLKDFTFRTSLSGSYYNSNSNSYRNMLHGQFLNKGAGSKSTNNIYSYTFNQILTWQHAFDKHHVEIMAGHENYQFQQKMVFASRSNFPVPGIQDLSIATTADGSGSETNLQRIESYLSRANYDYDSKYYLSASFRRDGSSRFYRDARWGNFWSVGGAWRISQERFMAGSKNWLDDLKLKVSYGEQGNDALIDRDGLSPFYYAWQSFYDVTYANGQIPGGVVASLENKALRWETSKNFNTGIEFGLFNRITGSIEYFTKGSSNLLFQVPMPASSGVTYRWQNIGSMVNKGIEVQLNADVVRQRNLTWNVGLNVSHFTNEITKLPPDQDKIIVGNKQLMVGKSIYDFFLLDYAGVDPGNGDALYYYDNPANGKRETTNDAIVARNNGGRVYAGSSIPDLYGGINSSLNYKGFDFSFLLSFGLGGKFYDGTYASLMSSDFGQTWSKDIEKRWQQPGDVTDVPRLERGNVNLNAASTRFLTSASYLNIRNVSLGYTLPSKLMSRAGFKSLRAYVSCDNLWLFSKRKGMDPQGAFDGNAAYSYSPVRTLVFGVNVKL
ncbi:SusC/RagA family TonB-linked outer membrane protein [Taibaiella chishuiensis]|uniref:TonB-linked SusC/RagA family outer membrane protein n=1 Tax=Taibaiella chishuiensis TaxID=1434707 RepID=A0A2P8DDB6_9BACT|nr:TonB-dependent receptor [Taibaiella chishuiensis]PSK95185.1 TonB-linked SusC/RagA family outer membrane protein [Taibaiella chishuiensis]